MNDFVKANIEKVLLVALLLIFCGVSGFLIIRIDTTSVPVVSEGTGHLTANQPHDMETEEPELKLDFAKTPTVVVCGEGAKAHLVDVIRFPTKSPIPPYEIIKQVELNDDVDSDGDGISDRNELKYKLDPANKEDAGQDRDGDFVTNRDEINYNTNLDDKSDYPSPLYAAIAQLKPVNPYPFTFRAQNLGASDKSQWELQFILVSKGRTTTRWKRMGDQLEEGCTLVDIDNTGDTVAAVIETAEGVRFKMKNLEKSFPPDSEAILLKNAFDAKVFTLKVGSGFEIAGPDGQAHKSVLKAWDGKAATATFLDEKTSDTIVVGKNAVLQLLK